MSQPAITVDNLSKAYRIGLEEQIPDTIVGAVSGWLKAPLRNLRRLHRLNTFEEAAGGESEEAASGEARATSNEDRKPSSSPNHSPLASSHSPVASSNFSSDTIWALRNVSFEVQSGEVVGIIGRNGAGKSTLLKILSRITDPTSGRAVINGRVASLLEVGTGFHPELTGRENVYMNGTILGMTKREIDCKFDEIIDFSGVDRFLDTPIKRYSSGMKVRLAFSVAAHLEPEILIIDEVLAVGDAAFQRKCIGKMNEASESGRTVLFVSHNMGAVRQLCRRTLWLSDGKVEDSGNTDQIIASYLQDGEESATLQSIRRFSEDPAKAAQLQKIQLVDHDGNPTCNFDCDHPITLRLTLLVRARLPGLLGYLEVQRTDGTTVLMSDSCDTIPNPLDELAAGLHEIDLTIPRRSIAAGNYAVYLNFTCRRADQPTVDSPGIVGRFRLDDFTSRRGNRRTGYLSSLAHWGVSAGVHFRP